MPKTRQRWLIRIAFDTEIETRSADKALAEIAKIVRVLEKAGYPVLDRKAFVAPRAGGDTDGE